MATIPVPPSASALINSLRGVGYSLETAIADLIDNSLAAHASEIDVDLAWNDGDPVVTISDDGRGMSASELVEALRFGGSGPDRVRAEHDLGRFGLGLKTASLSQCTKLTVVSRKSGTIAAYTWDLEIVKHSDNAWSLLEGDAGLEAGWLEKISRRASGTAVVWREIDFGRKSDRPDHETLLADLERLEQHLAMVFHRLIGGDEESLKLRLNGQEIRAWDPFLERHEATIRTPLQPIPSPGGLIKVQGFVLPHRDRFKNELEFEAAGGPEGWAAQQGFYVYRQKRLLSAGGWLGLGGSRMWTREEANKLARIRVDIPNTADQDWRIDIRKAIARPPDAVRPRLQQIAKDIRERARDVFVHRGQYGARQKNTEVERIWLVNESSSQSRYTINRDHGLVKLAQAGAGKASIAAIDAMCDLIERTVPIDRVWLDVSEKGAPPESVSEHELRTQAMSIVSVMEKAGVSLIEAAERVAAMDPFDRLPQIKDYLIRNGEKT